MPITYRITAEQLTQIHKTAIATYVQATALTRASWLLSGPARTQYLKKAASGDTVKMIEHLNILIGNSGATIRTSAADVASNGFLHTIDFIAASIRSIHSDGEQFILTLNDEPTVYSALAPSESDLAFRSKALNFRLDLTRNAHLTTPLMSTAYPAYTAPPMPATLVMHGYSAPATQYSAGPMLAVQFGQAIAAPVDAQTAARYAEPQAATVLAPLATDATIAAPTPRFSSKAV